MTRTIFGAGKQVIGGSEFFGGASEAFDGFWPAVAELLSLGVMTAFRLSIPNAVYAVFAYIIMLPFSLLLAAVVWADKVSGVLYLCTDSIGIFDFIPPFVHPRHGDVYYVPAWHVYLVWFLLLAGAFLLPALVIGALWLACRKEPEI